MTPSAGYVLVIGSAGLDIIGRANADLHIGTSNPSNLRMSFGGTARNVAENLARLGTDVFLITAVGDDPQGKQLLFQTSESGVNVDYAITVPDQPTGTYLAILDNQGILHLGMDDMRVIDAITSEYLRQQRELFKGAIVVFVDANLPPKTLKTAVSIAWRAKIPIAADPTSVSLAPALLPHLERLWLITPNETEAEILCPHPVPHADRDMAIDAARHLVSQGVDIAIITMAEFGLGYASADRSGHVPALHTEIVDPTGAGDALTAAVIFALLNDIPLDEAVRLGLSAAALTLRSPGTVATNLSIEMLYEGLR
ncbi:MAG: carbohydrate kinase family protein [Anaerolineaceae bacterium]|nr:MAG: carbohydrate kinase family protein [Anaerolineaceae bacterium]